MGFNSTAFNRSPFNCGNDAETLGNDEGYPSYDILLTGISHFAQSCKVHCTQCPCTGGFSGPVSLADQDFVYIDDNLAVRSGTVHTDGCASCSSNRVIVEKSNVVFIEDVAVSVAGSLVTGAHNEGPVTQDESFVSAT